MVRFTLKQLEYFVAAADGGSVAEAARRLNVSQPSVSAAIGKLEELLGVQLFLRHHAQGVSLTSAGQRLLAQARSLLAHAGELKDEAQGLGHAVRGRLDIGCFLTLSPMYMPELLTGFAAAHPETEVRLHEGHQDALLEGLLTGRFDAAILYDLYLEAELALEPLAELKPHALLPADHPLAGRRSVSLAELAPEPMVVLDVPPSRRYFTALFDKAGLKPRIRFHSPSIETVRGMVGNGAGYSLLVTRPAGDLTYDGRRIVCLPLADPLEPSRIVLARPSGARPTRLLECFGAHCKERFAARFGPPGGQARRRRG